MVQELSKFISITLLLGACSSGTVPSPSQFDEVRIHGGKMGILHELTQLRISEVPKDTLEVYEVKDLDNIRTHEGYPLAVISRPGLEESFLDDAPVKEMITLGSEFTPTSSGVVGDVNGQGVISCEIGGLYPVFSVSLGQQIGYLWATVGTRLYYKQWISDNPGAATLTKAEFAKKCEAGDFEMKEVHMDTPSWYGSLVLCTEDYGETFCDWDIHLDRNGQLTSMEFSPK